MPEFAGVCVEPDMPPEPVGLALYFSDILAVGVVMNRLGELVEKRVDVASLKMRVTGWETDLIAKKTTCSRMTQIGVCMG